jgi:molybdopterin synthase catalytic subunit
MIEKMLNEIKAHADPKELGMILVHNGVVRGTSKNGQPIKMLRLSFNQNKLIDLVEKFKKKNGIVNIKVWINRGELNVGDSIMYLLVAGKFRKNIMPVFEELLSIIKENIINEHELT